ncbi:MAG: bacterial Ig-like domain-containing protein [Bacilli bacterium]|nr:bacterial Ig-like domain-containing protein [Bacilli bacterium]
MKKIFLFLLVGFFAVVVAACGNLPTLESISISGQDVEFYVGEEFNTGELKVVAKLSDASTEDVTNQAVVSQEADMNKAGKYTVTVTYKGLKETYEITVIEDKLLSVNLENVETEYNIGDEVSFEGVVAKETYESGRVADADLATYDVVIKDAEGKEYTGAFAKVGKNTVKVSKGEVAYEFEVNVAANLYTSVLDAITAGVKNADKVANGTALIDNEGYVVDYEFAFGDNYTKVVDANGTTHYTLLEDGSAFGVVEGIDWEGNPYMEPAYEPLPEYLLGVDFRAVFNYAYDMYGVEGLVETLAYAGFDAINYQEVLPTEVTDSATYGFSYEIIIENFYYYFVNVEFVLDANSEVITEVKVEMNGYYFIYNEVTGEYEQPAEFGETPDFSRVVNANQVIGERNAENPYPLEELMIQSFELQDEEGNKLEDGAKVTAAMKTAYNIQVVNISPENANAAIDKIKVSFLDEFGMETWSVFGSYDYGYVTFTAYKAGNYQLVIYSANVSYTLQVEVAYAELESFNAAVYDADWWELVEAETATVYAGQVLQFGAIVNDGANPALTATCEGAEITEGEYYEFLANEVGTYVITLTSAVNPEFTATLTVTVEEAPSIAELLNGTYEYSDPWIGSATYVFTPASEGAANGELVITYEGQGIPAGTAYFMYEYVEGWLQAVPQNPGSYNCPFGVELDSSFKLLCTYNGWAQGELTKAEEKVEIEGALNGSYATIYVHPKNGFEFEMKLLFNVDGTGYYSFMNGQYEGTFEYTNVEGVITFTNIEVLFGAEVELSATISENVITCTAVFTDAGNELALEYTGGDEVEEPEVTTTPVVGDNFVNVSYWGSLVTFTAEEAGTYTIIIDDTIGCLMIESAGVWYQPSATVTLEAGQVLEIVVLLNVNGNDQVASLTISLN